MFVWRVPRALCLVLLLCVWRSQGYEDDIEPAYYNEIQEGQPPEPTTPATPCNTPTEMTKWDKLFSMMESSQMRENMLLQYTDDIIKVELGALRNEMFRFVAQYAAEATGKKMSLQMEARLQDSLGRLSQRDEASNGGGGGGGGGASSGGVTKTSSALLHQEAMLRQLLAAVRSQGVMSMGAMERTLGSLVGELKLARTELEVVLRSNKQRYLPAECETALLFPTRSRHICAAVIPDIPLSLSSFTVCLWAKPVGLSNRTVLFSYGTRKNPYEIQLLLSGTSALFTVGGETHLVEGRGVLKADGAPGWTHLCGAWSSEQGLAALWANGKMVASSPGVAEGHVIPAGGSLQLGQEKSNCCPGPRVLGGFDGGCDAKLAFAGKMTGVNAWDRVLAEEEIARLSSPGGCEQRGNVVAWAATEMVPHGGAQFVN